MYPVYNVHTDTMLEIPRPDFASCTFPFNKIAYNGYGYNVQIVKRTTFFHNLMLFHQRYNVPPVIKYFSNDLFGKRASESI